MTEIIAKAQSVRELLQDKKYAIDYYQREYQWQEKQVGELLSDLTVQFQQDYDQAHPRTKVKDYAHYFMGSIIISERDGASFVVDGQQRLTTLTLLLLHLRSLQKDRPVKVFLDNLVYSESYGQKSFNLDIEEREAVMGALFEGSPFDDADASASVRNIAARYRYIQEQFPAELQNGALPYFTDWLIDNVDLVEITAFSDEDAYRIFETMNDRGLSLTPTDMLKGYLLANIADANQRGRANELWRERVNELGALGKDVGADAIRDWLRSQYAVEIRERKSQAKPMSFDLLGTEFHRWVRDHTDEIGLHDNGDYARFITRDMAFFTRQYITLLDASQQLKPGLEHVFHNASHGFTLQYMLLLAPLSPDDSPETVALKTRLVGRYLDILLTWRRWNWRSIAYSTMQYAMFLVMRDIRALAPQALADKLYARLIAEPETFDTNSHLAVHQQNRYSLHRILARLTDYVETESGLPSHYLHYLNVGVKDRYEVEHVWAQHPERHRDEFPDERDFLEYRNRIGGLLLLPRSFNASYGDMTYKSKLPHYYKQNLLAAALHPLAYEHNTGFAAFRDRSGLLFRAHETYRRADLDERQELYRQIAKRIWDPEDLLIEVGL